MAGAADAPQLAAHAVGRCGAGESAGKVRGSSGGDAEVAEWRRTGVVEYVGEQGDVRPWLARSHVLVLPSYREGMPRTVLEAASMGRPAIVTDVPGCRQAVVDGETGWLCQVRDSESLAACMTACLDMSYDQLAEAGRAARRRIENEFDERIVIQAALDCLDRAVP